MRYALTDIHGCSKTLAHALEQMNFQVSDELFFLGDYIDRGPDSYGVLQQIWALEERGYKVTCLRGNHEQMLLDYHNGKRERYEWTPRRWHRSRTIDWMNGLKYYHETPGYLLVHAGLNFKSPTPLADKEAMLWERYWYDDIDFDWLAGRTVLHGHTPEPKVMVEATVKNMDKLGRLCIDTGCSHHSWEMGYLTVFNLDTRETRFFAMLD
ncbi:metallophosphoesterase family protein [Neolewinella antarctica]|uniref:Serine/threonine protein phosphatase 1 n=1 Tax=Neolewinella antarctica TaxID=442734 RepID=A0ABX0XBW3_9BACT|nr:metallophosphoesterase family protein [Neolewinella antarctica]NJC26414.1 serine/threonine protein phosphatase 1 [Neolewinella antarctica]